MIAADTSSLIAYLSNAQPGEDILALEQALANKHAILPPVVLTELLSDSKLAAGVIQLLLALPVLAVSEGYWQRAGQLRAKVLSSGHKARLADSLIAQSCIDHQTSLICRDRDFRHFTRFGLSLVG